MSRFLVLTLCLAAVIFAADMIPANIPASEIIKQTAPEAIEIESQCINTGITTTPPWEIYGRDTPWSTAAQVPEITGQDDQMLSMAYGPDGKIYVAYDAITSTSPLRYGTAIAWSTDQGMSWNNTVYYSTTASAQDNEIAVTEDGKIYIWGSFTNASYTNIPCFARSFVGYYNRPDTLAAWKAYNIPYVINPECVAWGLGHDFIFAQYTRDNATAPDSIVFLWSSDSTATGSLYYAVFTTPMGNPEKTTIAVDVVTDDTILIHGIEYYDATGSDWDVVCYQDSLRGSGNLYGWATGNSYDDRYPSVFATQGYAYIAYQGDVGGDIDIMFNSSTDYGQTWGGITDVADSTINETYPRLSGSGAKIGVDYICDDNRVQFNYSVNNGGTWLTTPELVDDNSSVSAAYHSVALLYTANYWHAAWQDTRNSGTEGIDIYASRRAQGQGLITHRPSELMFDYRLAYWGKTSSEKYTINHNASPIDEKLAETMTETSPGVHIPVMVMLAKQMNYDWLIPRCEQMSKRDRRQFVIQECQKLADETQKSLLAYLGLKQNEGKVSDVLPLWTTNTIAFNAEIAIILEISERSDIWCIGKNEKVEIIGAEGNPQPLSAPADFTGLEGREICWGVDKIGADHVWVAPLGYTGAGIVVGHMDTGVNYNHRDLEDHMWDGGTSYPNHGYDFVNEDYDPMDDDLVTPGHGTATAGIVAGDGTCGSNTGVAPDAQIMVLKCDGTNADMQQAVAFGLTHGADLLSTSLGFSNPSDFIKNWGRGQANTIYASGLVWTVAAGNGNPSPPPNHFPVPQDICTPADAPAPWYAPNGGNSASIGVGATTNADIVDTYSSYGPTSWSTGTYNDYPWTPGLIKPDVAAPGSDCKSLSRSNNNQYVIGFYGTSFAQPHVAGTVALMLDRNPALTPRQIDSLLQTTAIDIHAAGRDTLSGAGRIDAYQAVLVMSPGVKSAQLRVINQATATGILEVTDITKAHNKPWIVGINPTKFNVPINDSQAVWVCTDTTGQGMVIGGHYRDTLLVWSNTLGDDNPERVPVFLHYWDAISVEEQEELAAKSGVVLLSTAPNPFRAAAEIAYTLPSRQRVNLAVYDVCGKKVKALYEGYQDAGYYKVAWSGSDDQGQPLAAGVYFGRIECGGQTATIKLVLTK